MKKNIGKRILSLALALVMVAGWMPRMATEAHAAGPITLEGDSFTTDPGQGFTFRAYYYCGVCKERSYPNQPADTNHSIEITSFSYKISQGNISYTYGYKVKGCDGESTGSFSEDRTFDCSQNYNQIGWLITPPGLKTSHSVAVLFSRSKSAHQGDATCKTAANCTLCGTRYTNANNHEKPNEFTYSVNTSDSTGHDVKYACCGATKETVAHTAEPTYTVNATDHTKHDKTYSCCEGIAETTDHSYTYTADGFVLTETCTNGCGHTATATLTADDVIYTGSAIATGASVTFSDNWAGSKEHGEITYSNNLNVGNATAKVTVEGKVLTTTFKINAAKISGAAVTLNPTSGTYIGTAYNPSVSVTLDGFGTLVEGTDYTLSWNKTGFTNADTYTVTVTGKGNFEGTTERTFTINAANLADVKVEQVGTLTYTGEALTPAVSANAVAVNNQPITFTYSTESEGPYSTERPSFTNAGWAHTVYYRATADNHNTYYGSFLVEIEKATVIEPTIATKPYTGSEQTADVTDTDLYTVVKNEGGTGVKENGCYDVVLELKDPANYKWSITNNAQVTLQFKITRAENEWTVDPSITGWTYGEAAKVPVGEAKFGEVSVEYSGTTNGGAAYNGVAAPTEAGSYTATFIVQETEDYKGLETSVDFTIAKADYNMRGAKWNYREPFKYDGKEHKVEVVGLPTGVTVESYENNTATAVGDYYAEVNLTYDAHNYNAPTISKLGWTIYNDWSPTEYTATAPNGSSWTEDSDHNITFVVNGLFSKFVGIKVDGKDVDKANYEAKAGSTIITLKASYLDTLAVGKHTITVVYTDGSTDGTFNVHAKANSPATGDNSHMFLWIALLFISGGAVITLTVVERKRRMASNR